MKIACLSLVLLGSVLSSYAGLGNPSLSAQPVSIITYGSNVWTGNNTWTGSNTWTQPITVIGADTNTIQFVDGGTGDSCYWDDVFVWDSAGYYLGSSCGWHYIPTGGHWLMSAGLDVFHNTNSSPIVGPWFDDAGGSYGTPPSRAYYVNTNTATLSGSQLSVNSANIQAFVNAPTGNAGSLTNANSYIPIAHSVGDAQVTTTMTNLLFAGGDCPTLMIPQYGTYVIRCCLQLQTSNLTVASGLRAEFAIYYTNAEQATWTTAGFDTTASQCTNTFGAYTAATQTVGGMMATSDFQQELGRNPFAFRLFGRIAGTSPSVGAVKVVNMSLTAVKVQP